MSMLPQNDGHQIRGKPYHEFTWRTQESRTQEDRTHEERTQEEKRIKEIECRTYANHVVNGFTISLIANGHNA